MNLQGWKVGRDMQVKPVEVYYYQGHMSGWININITVDGIQTTLWATELFPPFDTLARFLTDILEGTFPTHFELEEEGPYKIFIAEAVDDKPDAFHFRMTGNGEEVFLDNLFDREQFVYAFFDDLILFMDTAFYEEDWGEPLLSPGVLERLEDLVKRSRQA